jgi:hypothetical protein
MKRFEGRLTIESQGDLEAMERGVEKRRMKRRGRVPIYTTKATSSLDQNCAVRY